MYVMLVDGFTGSAARNVRVQLGLKTDKGVFGHQGAECAVVSEGITDFQGRAQVHDGDPVLRVQTPGWSLRDSAEGENSIEVDLIKDTKLVVVNEDPDLPADLDTVVGDVLRAASEVRILVLQGMHFGCQAAALELIHNLRRVGYRGPINVMVDQDLLPYDDRCTVHFELFPSEVEQTDGQQFRATLTDVLQRIYPQPATVDIPQASGRDLSATVDLIPAGRTQVEQEPEALALALAHAWPYPVKVTVTGGTGDNGGAEWGKAGASPAAVFEVPMLLRSISEISIQEKLDILEPDRALLPMYENVNWHKGTRFPVTEDLHVIGMLACGEYSYRQSTDTFSDALGTRSVLAFQASNWKVNERYVRVDGQSKELCLPRASTYLTHPISTGNGAELVAAALRNRRPDLAERIVAMLRAVDKEALDLLVIYGLHQVRGANATQLLTNLRNALLDRESDRPCVVLTLYKYELAGVFDRLPDLLTMPEPESIVGSCFVHETAPLPQSVFQLLCEASTLPLVIGGANTSNLVRMLGKPHLSVEGGKPFQVKGQPGDVELLQLETLLRTPDLPREGVAKVAAFLNLGQTAPGKACDGYYPALQKWLHDPKRDQLRLGLYKLAQELVGRPPVKIV